MRSIFHSALHWLNQLQRIQTRCPLKYHGRGGRVIGHDTGQHSVFETQGQARSIFHSTTRRAKDAIAEPCALRQKDTASNQLHE